MYNDYAKDVDVIIHEDVHSSSSIFGLKGVSGGAEGYLTA